MSEILWCREHRDPWRRDEFGDLALTLPPPNQERACAAAEGMWPMVSVTAVPSTPLSVQSHAFAVTLQLKYARVSGVDVVSTLLYDAAMAQYAAVTIARARRCRRCLLTAACCSSPGSSPSSPPWRCCHAFDDAFTEP